MVTGKLPFKERRPRRMLLLMRRGPAFPPGLSPGEPAARVPPQSQRETWAGGAVLRQEEGNRGQTHGAPLTPPLPPAGEGEAGGGVATLNWKPRAGCPAPCLSPLQ